VCGPLYTSARKRIPGLFKDETGGRTMYEFVALRAKSYAYDIEHSTTIRAKGIRGHVIRNHLMFDDHKRCLFAVDNDDDDVESDERDDEFDAHMGKLIASSSARQVVACLHAAEAAAISTTPSTSYPLPPPPPPPQPLTHRPYELYTPYRENLSIRSFKHQMKTMKTMKLTLNRSDDKRHVLSDRVHTLAHGHYKII